MIIIVKAQIPNDIKTRNTAEKLNQTISVFLDNIDTPINNKRLLGITYAQYINPVFQMYRIAESIQKLCEITETLITFLDEVPHSSKYLNIISPIILILIQ